MTIYTNTFTNQLISPTNTGYNAISLTGNLTLAWPLETAPSSNLATPIIDIRSTGAFTVSMPPANQVSPGCAVLISNLSAFAISIVTNFSATLITNIAPGACFLCYIRDNASVDGVWGTLQYGAQTSAPTAAGLAGAGLVAVGSQLSQSIPVAGKVASYTVTTNDRALLLNWIGGAGTFTLPLAVQAGNNWYTQVRNTGSSALTLATTGSDTINGVASLTLSVGDSAFVVTDGVAWYTIGLGAAVNNNFNPVSINLAGYGASGLGNYTLPANQYARTGYTFFGALVGACQIIVPATAYQYWVDNQTTGGFTLTIGISGQASPPAIGAGSRNIYYYNPFEGTVIPVNTASIPTPVSIANGGTGQTTASAARNALGSTSVGDAVFISANQAAAQAALAAPSTADAVVFALSF